MANRAVWAEVDLKALEDNIRNIKSCIHNNAKWCAVVKADGYGHGAIAVARKAVEMGADYLAVAVLSEAISLRNAGFTTPILILGATPSEFASQIVDYDITQAVFSVNQAKAISAQAVRQNKKAKIHLKIDTGMHRIGIKPAEAGDFAKGVSVMPGIELEGMFSHFALADAQDKTYAKKQVVAFEEAIANVEKAGVNIPIKHIANSKISYKICQTMNRTYNWTTEGGGFDPDPANVPYVKAYDHSGTYKIAINIASATAAQRTSDDGITAYIPLPVGPVVSGGQNVYPQLKVWLAFNDNTEVPGSLRTASNVQIERAHIKPMPAIVMPKYTVETIITGLARTPHNLTRLSDDQFVVTAEQYHVYFLDVVNNTATQSAVNASSKYPPSPYGVCCIGNNLWIANKTGATGNCIYKYDMTTQLYSIVTTGINQAMQIQEHDGNVYVLGRGDGSNAGKIHVFTGNVPGAVDAEVFADFSGIASSGYAWPLSFAFDTDGSMVVAVSASAGTPSECFKLYRVASKGATPVAIFGSGTKASNYAGLVDGSSSSATFSANMLQMQFDGEGNLYIGDTFAVRKLVRGATGLEDGTIMTLTESGSVTNTDGLAMDSTCSHIYLSNKSTKSISKVTIE